MSYYVTSIIHLSLEEYYNNGLTPEEAKMVIERINDPGSNANLNLTCEPSGINNNWNVHTLTDDLYVIEFIYHLIMVKLDSYMNNK